MYSYKTDSPFGSLIVRSGNFLDVYTDISRFYLFVLFPVYFPLVGVIGIVLFFSTISWRDIILGYERRSTISFILGETTLYYYDGEGSLFAAGDL